MVRNELRIPTVDGTLVLRALGHPMSGGTVLDVSVEDGRARPEPSAPTNVRVYRASATAEMVLTTLLQQLHAARAEWVRGARTGTGRSVEDSGNPVRV